MVLDEARLDGAHLFLKVAGNTDFWRAFQSMCKEIKKRTALCTLVVSTT